MCSVFSSSSDIFQKCGSASLGLFLAIELQERVDTKRFQRWIIEQTSAINVFECHEAHYRALQYEPVLNPTIQGRKNALNEMGIRSFVSSDIKRNDY